MIVEPLPAPSERAAALAMAVEKFVRDDIIPFESDPRWTPHGPEAELVDDLRQLARDAGLLTPHILANGSHLSHRETALVFKAAGLSPLGPVALNVMAPDEGNMYLLERIASAAQKHQYLRPIAAGVARSAFFMTEPAATEGAGSDPAMLKTRAVKNAAGWILNGRKAFITGADGASVGIIMADTGTGNKVEATMFLVDLPNPAIRLDYILDTLDGSMPGGHAMITITDLHVTEDQLLGDVGEGFAQAQIRLAPARLTHCMRWLGSCIRANEIALAYACERKAFGKLLIDHEGVGYMLADNLTELRQSELMIDWVASVLDTGQLGIAESSMAKYSVSEALFRIADRCVQIMGARGVSGETIVERVFRETRAFRIYDGPTEVHKWSIARKLKYAHGAKTT
jgi:acyl-CoA dehydrogenase